MNIFKICTVLSSSLKCPVTLLFMPQTPQKFSKQVGQDMNGWDSASILSRSYCITTTRDDFTFHFRLTLTFMPIITFTQFTIVVLLKSYHKSVFIRISSTALSLKFSTQHFSKLRITDHLRMPARVVSNFN